MIKRIGEIKNIRDISAHYAQIGKFLDDREKNLGTLQAIRDGSLKVPFFRGLKKTTLGGILKQEYAECQDNSKILGATHKALASMEEGIDLNLVIAGKNIRSLTEGKNKSLRSIQYMLDLVSAQISNIHPGYVSDAVEARQLLIKRYNKVSDMYDALVNKNREMLSELAKKQVLNKDYLDKTAIIEHRSAYFRDNYPLLEKGLSLIAAKHKKRLSAGILAACAVVGLVGGALLVNPFSHKGSNVQKTPFMQEAIMLDNSPPQTYDWEQEFSNAQGKVPIEMFHYISNSRNISEIRKLGIDGRYVVSADGLRRHLQDLYERGFRPISIGEYINGLQNLPEGVKPVLLTLDDATHGQFDFLRQNNVSDPVMFEYNQKQLALDPDCFVAILQEFSKTHPDFRSKAAFAVDFANASATGYEAPFIQPEFVGDKLNLLLDMGFDIINHGMRHLNYSKLTKAQIEDDCGRALFEMQKYLGHRISQVNSFAFPYGGVPAGINSLEVLRSFSYKGMRVENQLLFGAWGGAAKNPHTGDQTGIIPRIEVCESTFPGLIYNRNDFYRTPVASSSQALTGNGQALK